MIQPVYKKGHRLVWIGFSGLALSNAIGVFLEKESLTWALTSLIYIAFGIVFIYGNLLVLRSKGRSWMWIILVMLPPVFGAVAIFWLKDKTSPEIPAPPATTPN